jgi:hypothetical protein
MYITESGKGACDEKPSTITRLLGFGAKGIQRELQIFDSGWVGLADCLSTVDDAVRNLVSTKTLCGPFGPYKMPGVINVWDYHLIQLFKP